MAEKKNSETTEKKNSETTENNDSGSEQITIDKAQLEAILSNQEALRKELEEVKSSTKVKTETLEQIKLKKEEEIIAKIETANAQAEEITDYYVDLGSMKSNKNLEVNINGIQYTIPKGEHVKLKKGVIEVIENAKKQQSRATGLQDRRAEEAKKAIEAGRI